MLLKRIDHVTIFISDMDKAIEFYTTVLGLTLRFKSTTWSEVGVSENGVFVGLHLSNKDLIQNDDTKNTSEVTFLVTEIQQIQEKLKQKGVTFTRNATEIAPGQYVANFLDIDGNKLALHESKTQ